MQNFRYVILLCVLVYSPLGFGESLFDQKDKQNHLLVSACISAGSYAYFRSEKYSRFSSIMGSIAITTFVGSLKELVDPSLDSQDLQADTIGMGTGLLLGITFDW